MLLLPDKEIDLGQFTLQRTDVDDYLEATSDCSTIYANLSIIPPLALVAHTLKEILERLALPPGTLHATQEVKCIKVVNVGAKIRGTLSLSRPLQRGDWQFVPAVFILRGTNDEIMLTGKTTVIVPLAGTTND